MAYDKKSFILGLATGLATRGVLRNPAKEGQIEGGYIKFYGNNEITLTTSRGAKTWDGDIEYSVDGKNWMLWNGEDAIQGINKQILLRGYNNTVITGQSSTTSAQRFVLETSDNAVYCQGNIENLLDCDMVSEGVHPTMSNYCFFHFLAGDERAGSPYSPIRTMFDLPSPVVPAHGYRSICYKSYLETAPVLPAIQVGAYAYYNALMYTPRLQSAASLPATSLGEASYYQMYYGSAISTIPALPQMSSTLPRLVYYRMFAYCQNIKMSETQTGEYTNPYPILGRRAANGRSTNSMFEETGGTYKGSGGTSTNTVLYTSNEVV